MTANQIVCPHCHGEIQLSDLAKHTYELELASMQKQLTADFAKEKEALKDELRKKALEWATKKSEEDLGKMNQELSLLKETNEVLKKEKQIAYENELQLRKKQADLEERSKMLDLEIARRVQTEKEELEKRSKVDFESQMQLERENYKKQIQEQEKKLENVTRSLEEAQGKARRGSQQIQGEVQENELKAELMKLFPQDLITDVPTGIRGADLVHEVMGITGRREGLILWESKNTKTFSNDWIKKLKDDAVAMKADLAIIVTQSLPESVEHFGIVDGVWVTDVFSYKALIAFAREKILSLAQERKIQGGKEEKMQVLYGYLGSQEFRGKIEGILDAFASLKEDLESEKRSMNRIWAKREKELERVITHTSYLYGDIEGIMGQALPPIERLSLAAGDEEIPH